MSITFNKTIGVVDDSYVHYTCRYVIFFCSFGICNRLFLSILVLYLYIFDIDNIFSYVLNIQTLFGYSSNFFHFWIFFLDIFSIKYI